MGREDPYTPLWEYNLVQPLWKSIWRFLRKLKIEVPLTQAAHFWAFPKVLLRQHTVEILVHPWLLLHWSQ